ncbi:protein phosphatase 2C domain-containing protein [Antribacter gilvus]|uniref:protein phosphatase 2C domain-containing protein n=1 Tax=Antribacter gilvus TaxID=2304675 RepID=UPI000F78FB24|nr:protein phosphatase 2C domain-containing protein [Antribacter gilvus]
MRTTIASVPGSTETPNEDATQTGSDLLVLLDGATARTASGCIHGVAWYAQHLAAGIAERIAIGPTAALAAAIAQTSDLHRDTCDLTHPGTPSAAVAIVHVTEDTLKYLVLGDVTIVIASPGGLQVVSDQRISQSAPSERATADAMPATDPRKPEALVRMKHAELAARNTAGGYWIAAADPEAARHALTGEVPVHQVTEFAVLSDGAARAVDAFGIHDWPGALAVLREDGPTALIAEVRAAEASDPEATRWPRNKLSDDATAAYCRLEVPSA